MLFNPCVQDSSSLLSWRLFCPLGFFLFGCFWAFVWFFVCFYFLFVQFGEFLAFYFYFRDVFLPLNLVNLISIIIFMSNMPDWHNIIWYLCYDFCDVITYLITLYFGREWASSFSYLCCYTVFSSSVFSPLFSKACFNSCRACKGRVLTVCI